MTSKQKDGTPSREEDKREKDTMKDDESDASENSGAANANSKNKSKRKASDEDDDDRIDDDVPLSFPQRMMEMLSDESHSDIVCWLPHGKGFVILDKKRFAHEVMPKYFNRRAKFTSFTRKLNRWSFTRVTRGPENGAYYHPLFQKNNLRLCLQMSCINSKSNQAIQPMNPIALGMGPSTFPPGMMAMMPGMMNDPQKLFQQELQNQRFMSMAVQPPAVPGQPSSGEPSSSSEPNATSTDVSSSDNNGANAASMAAFQMQQRQYYAMLMAQQQQMAAMAASNPAMMAQQQQMFQQQQQALMGGTAVETAGKEEEEEGKDAASVEAGAGASKEVGEAKE